MLVLEQQVGDQIKLTIGEIEIVVKTVSRRSNRIKIGIEAPKEVAIIREVK